MGSVADACDIATAKSFGSTPKRDLTQRYSWPNQQTARTAVEPAR
jgi:hypothetical protein